MHCILIVDDERIEREGMRNLIRRSELELETLTAENGEAALAIVRNRRVDIVITDIKMPFMDGLELAEALKREKPEIELILYSAFNEFEYARRAIRTNVSNYLLKPIQVPEFLAAVRQAVQTCEKKEADRERERELLEGYRRGMAYEREKMLLDAVNGTGPPGRESSRVARAFASGAEFVHLLLADCAGPFFDLHNDEVFSMLRDRLDLPFDYLNLNENQSLLFVRQSAPLPKAALRTLAESLRSSLLERFGREASVIVGAPSEGWEHVHEVYADLERLLEFKFFLDDHGVLFAEEHFTETSVGEVELDVILEKIDQYLNYRDIRGAKYGLELLFASLKTKERTSSLYIKFLCSDIMNKMLSRERKNALPVIRDYLERISRSSSLNDLKTLMFELFDTMANMEPAEPADSADYGSSPAKPDSAHRTIERIRQLVQEHYDQDLSLEGIAEQVYLSPSYLSYLFKKETGQSLIRYITQTRLEKAAELLKHTHMKVVDIGGKMGYRSANYFIQSFRQYYGVTPAKYREISS
ncbi:response regulator [Saccharibacillus sp. CPCC 101409]|uniref:response regulator transcription factor n=1 Tax=Saccharibacillus sp. CPCC 101409 TaxID=3058041 RepID=UPI00267263BA|nr:response regulator [Saccharibacillus sp. CPCC 101409]MDO3412521.1 response regulator [Saccharibacillus sp. CPCC 101409]